MLRCTVTMGDNGLPEELPEEESSFHMSKPPPLSWTRYSAEILGPLHLELWRFACDRLLGGGTTAGEVTMGSFQLVVRSHVERR